MTPTLTRNFSDEQVKEVFRTAIEITQELDPPEDLRLTVFNGVASMVANFNQQGPSLAVPPAMAVPRGRG